MRDPCPYALHVKDLDFEAIFERYHQPLYRFCLSIVGNAEDAREALQNTMVKALRALPGEEREIQLKPWLYRVAHNESIDLLRRRRDRVEIDAELASPGASLAEEAEVRERLRLLLADLRELPDRQRAALVMRELGGLGFDEIGEAFSTSAAVARQTVYEARLSLQQLKAGREMSCEKVRRELSAEDGRVARRRDIRAHLRDCAECRAFQEAIAERRRDLAALAPLPAPAAAGVLHAVLGCKAASGGAVAASGALGKVAATSTMVKSVATVAVVAAVAVPAADRSGLLHAGIFDRGSAHGSSRSQTAGSTEGARAATLPTARRRTQALDRSGATDGSPAASEVAPGSAASQDGEGASDGATQPTPSDTSGPGSRGNARTGASEGNLPQASAHGQETAAAHGGGRESAGSKSRGHAHAPKAPPEHGHSKPNPGHGNAPDEGTESSPPGKPPVQAPAVPPDKGGKPPLQPSNANPAPPEEAGGDNTKEAR
jgi:RNA polymerase sigma factor (sigma-70 family)